MKEIKDVSGDRFSKWHVLNVFPIIIQCAVSLQKPFENLPMFYRAAKQLLLNCKLFDKRILYKHMYSENNQNHAQTSV